MRLFKIISLVLSLLLVMCCVGCGDKMKEQTNSSSMIDSVSSNNQSVSDDLESDTSSVGSDVSSDNTSSTGSTVDLATCSHSYESSITKHPRVLDEGEKTFTCKLCKHTYTEKLPKTKTLKVLALGNSFSVDAMEYLWDIANDAGVENIVLGNLYIASCNLDMHWENISNSKASYTYYKNTTGKWNTTKKTSVQTALADEEWDIISIQQSSGKSAQLNTFGNLSNIVNYLTTNEPNARLVWHMTWSYQHDNTKHGIFKEFDRDPIKMYNAIVSAYQQNVQPNKAFTGITPCSTAVQNLRSSYIGDTITRDTYHLSFNHGRYLAALTWFAALTGGDVDSITWLPSDYPELADDLPVIRQSVKDAMKQPFAVTQQTTTK